MQCSICRKPAEKRGWCQMHYRRWQRHGDPLTNLRPEQVIGPLEKRFWAKVKKGRGCWEWQGWRLHAGYGHFRTTGSDPHGARTWLAHRLAYTIATAPIPQGMEIHHRCDNPPCVKPAHLELVTHTQNLHYAPNAQFKRNAAKTHCKSGHPFDDANTLRRPDRPNYRGCRACGLVAVARYQAKKQRGQ